MSNFILQYSTFRPFLFNSRIHLHTLFITQLTYQNMFTIFWEALAFFMF